MKYFFLVVLCWTIGFVLPLFTTTLQWIGALLFLAAAVICVVYYIDTRINPVRL